jgi:hypothetical protein
MASKIKSFIFKHDGVVFSFGFCESLPLKEFGHQSEIFFFLPQNRLKLSKLEFQTGQVRVCVCVCVCVWILIPKRFDPPLVDVMGLRCGGGCTGGVLGVLVAVM